MAHKRVRSDFDFVGVDRSRLTDVKALMTLPSAESDRLMCWASLRVFPAAPTQMEIDLSNTRHENLHDQLVNT